MVVVKTIIIGCPTKIQVISDDWTTVKTDRCYLFTSAAFVFNSFNESPLHFSQKQSSARFSARGSLLGYRPEIAQVQSFVTTKTTRKSPWLNYPQLHATRPGPLEWSAIFAFGVWIVHAMDVFISLRFFNKAFAQFYQYCLLNLSSFAALELWLWHSEKGLVG